MPGVGRADGALLWPPYPLDGKGGALAEPLMVIDTKLHREGKFKGGNAVVYGARAKHCDFWDTLSYVQTPED